MAELTANDIGGMQIVEELPNGKIRLYNITEGWMGDENDPLTTIHVDGYQDVEV